MTAGYHFYQEYVAHEANFRRNDKISPGGGQELKPTSSLHQSDETMNEALSQATTLKLINRLPGFRLFSARPSVSPPRVAPRAPDQAYPPLGCTRSNTEAIASNCVEGTTTRRVRGIRRERSNSSYANVHEETLRRDHTEISKSCATEDVGQGCNTDARVGACS